MNVADVDHLQASGVAGHESKVAVQAHTVSVRQKQRSDLLRLLRR